MCKKESAVSNRMTSLVRSLGTFAFVAAMATPAAAQATRTWASGVGDDVNPCSRTAPCKTFAGAISKTAAGGEIDTLDPGGFGTVTITKAITIDGSAGMASILASGTNGVIVSAGPNDVVTLRNLSINGAGTTLGINGVRVLTGREVNIENCVIFGFSNNGIDFIPSSATMNVLVTNTTLAKNAVNGIFARTNGSFFARLTMSRVRLDRNGAGVTAGDNSLVFVSDSVAANNTGNGFVALSSFGGPAQLTLQTVQTASNGNTGVLSQNAAAAVRLSDSAIDHNGGAGVVSLAGGQILSNGNNRSTANAGGDGAVTGSLVVM